MAPKQTDRNSEPETLRRSAFLDQGNKQPTAEISTADREAIRQYLLGHFSDDRQRQFEERLLAEDEFFEELEIGEDELIDEYLDRGLPDTERARFERHFLATPERQKQVRLAQVMRRHTESAAPSFSWWNNQNYMLRVAAAVAAVITLAGVLWFIRYRTAPEPTFATLVLTVSHGNRSMGSDAARAKPGVDELRIALLLERSATASRYRAELTTQEGQTRALEITGQDAQSVSVMIPAARLSRGQYAIKLFAISADGIEQRINGSYLFTIE